MALIRGVCLRCRSKATARHQLPFVAARKSCRRTTTTAAEQQQALSTSNGAPETESRSQENPNIRHIQRRVPASEADGHGEGLSQSGIRIRRVDGPWAKDRKVGLLGAAPRRTPTTKSDAIHLFEETLRKEQERGVQATTGEDRELIQLAAQLLEQDSAVDRYSFLKNVVIPATQGRGKHIPKILYQNVLTAMGKVTAASVKDYDSPGLPTFTELSRVYTHFGVWDAEYRLRAIMHLLHLIVVESSAPDPGLSGESSEGSLRRTGHLVDDLVGVWKHLSQQKAFMLKRDYDEAFELKFDLSRPPFFRKTSRYGTMWQFEKSATGLFSQYMENQLQGSGFSQALLVTWALLLDPGKTPLSTKRDAMPLIDAVDRILKVSPVNQREIELAFKYHQTLMRYVASHWPTLTRPGRLGLPRVSKGRRSVHELYNCLSVAIKASDVGETLAVFEEIQGDMADETRRSEFRKKSELFDQLLFAWCCFGQSEELRATVSLMQSLGLKSTAKSLAFMLEGYKKGKHFNMIEDVWNAISLQKKLKLDTTLWTIRVSALMEACRPTQAIQALQAMKKLWKDAVAAGTQDMAVKPTIEPVNAALAGLLRLQGMSAAQELLSWASKQGIEPDIITYNTLLQPMLREGLSKEADDLLATMEKEGIRPDAATFTIVAETALDKVAGQDELDLEKAVENLLATMEAWNLPINHEVYGKVLYTLLRTGDLASGPTQKVLEHMSARELDPSPHMYTIIAQYYLSRNPPDIAAVERLTSDSRAQKVVAADGVFWQTVAEGYARAGKTGAALAAFNKAVEVDNRASLLPVAEHLIRGLVAESWTEDAERVVRIMLERVPQQAAGEDARVWKHHFWHLAKNYGLLPDDAAERIHGAKSP
jgi:pentatricopeptide repeat protein